MHKKLDSRDKKGGHMFSLLIASDHNNLRPSVDFLWLVLSYVNETDNSFALRT